ncbi:hypothetical protein FXO38_22728 [Capsicum annuum]|nr:hypothetical protein FXO38_22728 [Capsicum annuum]
MGWGGDGVGRGVGAGGGVGGAGEVWKVGTGLGGGAGVGWDGDGERAGVGVGKGWMGVGVGWDGAGGLYFLDEMIKEYSETHLEEFGIGIQKETIQLIKMQNENRIHTILPIPRLNESFHLATAKVEFGTGQRGKQGGIPLWKGKGQFQTKDPGASFPVSKCQVSRADPAAKRKLYCTNARSLLPIEIYSYVATQVFKSLTNLDYQHEILSNKSFQSNRLFAEIRNISNWIGYNVPNLSAIDTLMYLANTTRLIAFSVNLLARYISAPTMRHQNGIKHMSLFYSKDCSPGLIGHADVGYLSDPHKARSQIGYVFICGGIVISWRYTKQSIVATSSNHAEIMAIHEASRECVWMEIQQETLILLVDYNLGGYRPLGGESFRELK